MNPEQHLPQRLQVALGSSAPTGQVETEKCPWCDSIISRAKFFQIRERIAEEERRRLSEERLRIDEEVRREKEEFQARLEEEAADKLAALADERDQAAAKLKELQEREVTVRQEAASEAEARVRAEAKEELAVLSNERDQTAAKLKELQEREVTVRQEAASEAEARVRAEAKEELAVLSSERDQAAAKLKELQEREVTVRQEAASEAEARVRAEAKEELAVLSNERDQAAAKAKELEELASQHQQELSKQRSALERDRDLQLAKQAEENAREREQLSEKVASLTKQIEQKTASELGVEVDVFEALQAHFQGDDIKRIRNNAPGADILLTALYDGQECGSIIIDSKNHQQWRAGYLENLRKDQLAAKADHAILATRAFPQGKRELYVDPETRIIVVSHARVVEIVELLRISMLQVHRLGLSLEQRSEKRDRLYEYLTSEDFHRNMDEATRLTNEIAELDVEEQKWHGKTWEKRGSITCQLRNAIRDIHTEVSTIIAGK